MRNEFAEIHDKNEKVRQGESESPIPTFPLTHFLLNFLQIQLR